MGARARGRWPAAGLALLIVAGAAAGQPVPASPGASFTPSDSGAAAREFIRGVEALHHFEYEQANEAFLRAQQTDPALVMAVWGEAMTYHQTLWRHEDVAAGRRALARLGPTPAARAATAPSAKERALLEAVDSLFGDGDEETRRRRYAQAMADVHARYPDDPEAAAFYALALMGTTSRSLIGYVDDHEGHSASLAGSETQRAVGDILSAVLRSHPEHPGALHYLLHNYDDPEHARLGLEAARTYARVAPDTSSHAQHMPAHIFVQLGMWDAAAESDRVAFAASEAWVATRKLPLTMRSYHALSWLQYELLQLGRFREAWDTVGTISPVVTSSGDLTLLSDLSSMRARFVIETRRWSMMANERTFGNINELCAIGISAARSGNPALAELARQALATRSTAPEEGDLRPAAAIMEREVAAVIELVAGRGERAVDILRAAAAAELNLPPPLGLPIPLKPAPELLGEVLLEVGRPAEAIGPFQQALSRNANRTLSLLGLARATAALGQVDESRGHYEAVLSNLSSADPGLAEVAEAQAAVAGAGASMGFPWGGRAIPVALALLGLAALCFVAYRRHARAPHSSAGRPGLPRGERRRRKVGRR